jgi:hypothetical protein
MFPDFLLGIALGFDFNLDGAGYHEDIWNPMEWQIPSNMGMF